MKTDLFISYAWTSAEHCKWVHLFASHLHMAGFIVKIDEIVDYGSSLSGFMREMTDCAHVLMIVDPNYVERANNMPLTGVAIENRWIREVLDTKPETWLSVMFVDNPNFELPAWLSPYKPKGFDFNYPENRTEYPGASQIEAIWRWIEGLPADKNNAVSIATYRERCARLEHADTLLDPANYTNPALNGCVTFNHRDHSFYSVGYGDHKFDIMFDQADSETVRIYKDYDLKAVWKLQGANSDPLDFRAVMRPTRTVCLMVGQKAMLLNNSGMLCEVTIEEIQPEVEGENYVKEYVTFSYKIHHNK
ncbi:TIR domain-containing protein [Pantoea ananatis]|uniref:TIR domain-containing protein n=1 Tax=Pantoea ananas TaxID=553 RepID=UPI000762E409|nr:TIR domain-containing protein [Pantoea ananatis]AMB73329.1 hypothetical protein AW734_00660 [Pantoea ananatis]URL16173.1 toll/interleukin-1 receptor domain-containing protein [Pantoea ananatis]